MTLLARGLSHRRIADQTGVNRRTISKLDEERIAAANGGSEATTQNAPARPPAPATLPSACEPHREWIEGQVALGRNAMALYQDLVDHHQFKHGYNSVKRFVRTLRQTDPDRFDVLEFLPGEEAQVDYGQGAPTRRPGKETYGRPYLFVMTLRNSRKSFRKTVWKTSQYVWAQLHIEAWRSFGGSCRYVVLDNLKEGVITPDLYEPRLNPVYAALLGHYGVSPDPCRVRDPNRKGTVESAIKHTQSTALKGRRFETIEEQNQFLANWEERWAAARIHGRTKRRVHDMFEEERPHLQKLPAAPFRPFEQEERTVDDSGCVIVAQSYYSALPAAVHTKVWVRIYDREIEVVSKDGELLRRHQKSTRRGTHTFAAGDRPFNPSRETLKLFERVCTIGPNARKLAEQILASQDRAAQKQIYGFSNLAKSFTAADIEAVAGETSVFGHSTFEAALKKRLADKPTEQPKLAQSGEGIREIGEYADFFERSTNHQAEESNP